MTAVTYVAKRSLIAGHSVGDSISLNLILLADTPGWTRTPNNVVNESMSGKRETMRLHVIKTVDVSVAPLTGAALAAVREFLDSVESGEDFIFDLYGTTTSAHLPVTAALETGGYSEARYQSVGHGGSDDYFTLQFKVRTVAT